MKYPTEILPNSHFKLIDCDLGEHYLIRHTPSNQLHTYYDEEEGRITDKGICFPEVHMYDLSCSLFGIFHTAHTKTEILNRDEYNHYCNPDESVRIPIFKEDFDISPNRGYWFVKIADIVGNSVEYRKTDNWYSATCVTQHTPMKWNFWHFSITWFLSSEGCNWKDLNNPSNSWTKRFAHETVVMLREHATIVAPEATNIDADCYIK